jgi:hypothetical protein
MTIVLPTIVRLLTYLLLITCMPVLVRAKGASYEILQQAASLPRTDLIFLGAVGFGAFTQAGESESKVLVVTTLEDSDEEGTLRWALSQPYRRTIAFNTGGIIVLKKDLIITNPQVLVDGSVVREGITLQGGALIVENTHDIILRYIRVRPGIKAEKEAVRLTNSAYVVLDHCSLSGATDSILSIHDCSFVSVQRCLIAESISPQSSKPLALNNGFEISFVENLFANITMKDVCVACSSFGDKLHRTEFINNYFCFYKKTAVELTIGEAPVEYHFRNNYFAYPQDAKSFPIEVWCPDVNCAASTKERPEVKIYMTGNQASGSIARNISYQDPWMMVRTNFARAIIDSFKAQAELFRTHLIDPFLAQLVPNNVLPQVGASLQYRDAIDQRIIKNVREGRLAVIRKTVS